MKLRLISLLIIVALLFFSKFQIISNINTKFGVSAENEAKLLQEFGFIPKIYYEMPQEIADLFYEKS